MKRASFHRTLLHACSWVFFSTSAIAAFAEDRVDVFPDEVLLTTSRHPMRVFVTRTERGAKTDVTKSATFAIDDENTARLVGGRVVAVANGTTSLKIAFGKQKLSVPVTVSLNPSERLSLKNDVLPVLSRQGCSSGACHGSPKGKGGFRLSLRAFDPAIDEATLRNEFFSRRINPLNADTSLLLRKPLMEVPHAGGRRLFENTVQHNILRDWISQGASIDEPDMATCKSIELFPASGRELTDAHANQQFSVYGRFSNGDLRDITDLCVFTSSNTAVANVSSDGLAEKAEGARGQTAISARYLEHMATSFVLAVPNADEYEWPNPAEANYIDRQVNRRLQQLRILPSPRSRDAEFVRRVHLDVTGLLPTTETTTQFLADDSPEKRRLLIDKLLETPEHAKFMALKWGDILRIKSASVSSPGVFKYHRWLVRSFDQNMPYDDFAKLLLTSSGSSFENPPVNYFRTAVDTNDCTESTAQVFLGARLECAKCHNHPHERWTQDNYYGLGAFFNRIQRDTTERPNEVFVSVAARGEVTQPRTGQTMQPWLPGVGELGVADDKDRRTIFADWLTKTDNPFFARVEVNRLWSQMFGKGIVDPIDDFRDSNPPSNAALLDELARDFAEHNFDRRHILRTILNSQTYQRSSVPIADDIGEHNYAAHYNRRLLSAEQLMDAISDVTGVADQFSGLPPGTRATQLPSPDFGKSFLQVFGRPKRKTVCQCERSDDVNLSQALQLANGSFLNDKVMDSNCRFRVMLKGGKSQADIVRYVYLAAYSRPPTDKELQTFADYAADSEERTEAEAYEDLFWSILNTHEFLFQH